jgi:uncharacterized protein
MLGEIPMRDVQFQGEAGKLEGKFHRNANPYAPVAVLLHPAKQFEGSMHNIVMYQSFYALAHRGYSVLRFNFRGVGKSQGAYDHGEGELSDATTALDWMQDACPLATEALVLGFSFGAWIGMQMVARRPEISKFICIAPAPALYDFSFISTDFIHSSGLIVGAGSDRVAPPQDVKFLADFLNKKKFMAHYDQIEGANHFFTGHIIQLMQSVAGFIEKGNQHAA